MYRTIHFLIFVLVIMGASLAARPTFALSTQLAGFDAPPNSAGTTHQGEDFDPQLDNLPTCSGCWYSQHLASSGPTHSYGFNDNLAAVTQGTGSLRTTFVGKGAGGGYTATINGQPAPIDMHFDNPFIVTYSNNPAANGGVVDPRFTAIDNAVDGEHLAWITFDIIYDIASMRAIPWQAPEETINPGANGQYPERFVWIGMYGNSNVGPFTFSGFDQNRINPFDAQWDNNLFPIFHASFLLSGFDFVPGANHTFYQFGILYNSTFGTLPASENTSGINIYIDNVRLIDEGCGDTFIDYNNNCRADEGDFALFMEQYLKANPDPRFDLVGDFGSRALLNSRVDFFDLQEFERFYALANFGGGSTSNVPEPGTIVTLLVLAGLAPIFQCRQRAESTWFLAIFVSLLVACGSSQAQIVESFNTLGNWTPIPLPPPDANPTVTLVPTPGGGNALRVTQHTASPIGQLQWVAGTTPAWSLGDTAFDVLREAVNVGAEHFNLRIDTTFDPALLPDVGSLEVSLGLNFVGQTVGVYSGETTPFSTTAEIPLAMFHLPDFEDQGATNYSAQIGFTTSGVAPMSVVVDNIRLVQVSTPSLLTLEVEQSEGSAVLWNRSGSPISWNYLEIKSPSGSLDPAGWESLDDQDLDGVDTWIEAGGSSSTYLVEASLSGSHTLFPGEYLPLGHLYDSTVRGKDLDLEIRLNEGPAYRTFDQEVRYWHGDLIFWGDYNNDGSINAADYVVWRNNFGTSIALPNRDPLNTGPVNTADYDTWKANFGKPGAGSGGLGGVAVPEPSAFVGMLMLSLGLAGARWKPGERANRKVQFRRQKAGLQKSDEFWLA